MGDSTWDGDGDIDVVLLHVQLGNDVGCLGGDSGMSSDGSSDLGLDNGVSGSGSSWNGSRWDSGIRSGDGWVGDGFLAGNDVVVSSDDLLDSGLDGSVSYDSVLNTVFNHWGSSGVGVMGLSDDSGGAGNGSSDKSGSVSDNSGFGHGGPIGTGHKGTSDHKSVHVSS